MSDNLSKDTDVTLPMAVEADSVILRSLTTDTHLRVENQSDNPETTRNEDFSEPYGTPDMLEVNIEAVSSPDVLAQGAITNG